MNAITYVLEQSAMEAARVVDRTRVAGEKQGPLAGVPFTVKENIDVAGSATTHGVPALRNAVASVDATIVERLRRAGAIPLGRTNLQALSIRFHTSSQFYGDTLNPCPSRTSESVTGGHPDKVVDQISGAALDAVMEQDSYRRVACGIR